MEKEFVPYELALRMKKLGFQEDSFGDYFKCNNENTFLVTDENRYRIIEDNLDEDIEHVSAPLYQHTSKTIHHIL